MSEFKKYTIGQQLKESEDSFKTFGRTERTELIKRLFACFFKDTNYSVYANKMGDESKWHLITDEQEWLFDLIIVDTEESEFENIPFITKTVLSLESELEGNIKAVIDDFQKLLIANSDYKVMVFNCHSTELKSLTSYMETNIKNYKKANGIFYLVSFLNDLCTFELIEIITDN